MDIYLEDRLPLNDTSSRQKFGTVTSLAEAMNMSHGYQLAGRGVENPQEAIW